jgi:hypothetical protein
MAEHNYRFQLFLFLKIFVEDFYFLIIRISIRINERYKDILFSAVYLH